MKNDVFVHEMILRPKDAAGIGTRYACFDRMARALLGGTAVADLREM